MIEAGKYRTLVDFQEDHGMKNPTTGQQEESWATYAPQVWCEVIPLSGRQLIAAQQLVTNVTHRITTRFNPTVPLHPRLRARIGARILFISYILNVGERDTEWEMLCTEVQ